MLVDSEKAVIERLRSQFMDDLGLSGLGNEAADLIESLSAQIAELRLQVADSENLLNSILSEPNMGAWDDFCAVYPVPFDKFLEAYKAMFRDYVMTKPTRTEPDDAIDKAIDAAKESG